MHRIVSTTLALVLFAGCATLPEDPTAALTGANVRSRVEANGDAVSEYRVAGQLRVVKIVPKHGVTYYLTDDDNDGRLDHRRGEGPVTPVQYKVFGW